jgi:hypothetical protein
MITAYAPLKRSLFQPIDFGVINYNYPPPGLVSGNIDEIIISNVSEGDPNQVDFIKRYNTWFLFTAMDRFPLLPYNIILINYDRVNRVAYTYEDTLRILRKA